MLLKNRISRPSVTASIPGIAQGMLHAAAAVQSTAMFRRAAAAFINQAFRAAIARGELDFLQGRRLGIRFDDLDVISLFTFESGRVLMLSPAAVPEVTIRGRFPEFVRLAARQVDPDTLFFQRRLAIEGDVSLGLTIKNFLDALELEEFPVLVRMPLSACEKLLGILTPSLS